MIVAGREQHKKKRLGATLYVLTSNDENNSKQMGRNSWYSGKTVIAELWTTRGANQRDQLMQNARQIQQSNLKVGTVA
ncbi:hypothetical protein AMECASPLE_032452 [Ameca splendens]|uniref:Uncharacterized protein n=1 Tax=Ameca splendens TaxID=208324 RepID=A0ABV0Y6G6_9TELE